MYQNSVIAFEKPTVPSGADAIVAVLATEGPPEHYSADDIANGDTTFRIVTRGDECAVMRRYRRRFLWWSWFKEDFVRTGYVPMTWKSISDAQNFIDDLTRRAAAVAGPWRNIEAK